MDKVLTIIIPAYNMEKYLENTLNSCVIKNQEIRKLYEVIIVNDGSKDRTHDIAQRYVNKYSDTETFKIIDKKNGGYGSAINEGLCIASGEYLKILDGDDWYNTKELEKLIIMLQKTNIDIVLTNYTIVNDYTRESVLYKFNIKENTNLYMDKYDIPLQALTIYSICYRVEILRNNHIRITEHCYYTDSEYELYPLVYAKNIIYYSFNIYQYRIGREGQSVSVEGIKMHINDQKKVLDNMNLYFDSNLFEVNKELIERKLAEVYAFYISSILLLPCCKENKDKIVYFIRKIKNRYPQRYKYMVNKKIILLEKLGAIFYIPYCLQYQFAKKIR